MDDDNMAAKLDEIIGELKTIRSDMVDLKRFADRAAQALESLAANTPRQSQYPKK